MLFNKELLDGLSEKAKVSPRLRMNLDLRNSSSDTSQRMLNAIEPGTEVPVHRHPFSQESCIILRGAAEEIFYDDNGKETERIALRAGSDCAGVQVPVGVWHRITSLESGTVIFEAKDGAFTPTAPEDIMTL